jgi:hypothetical protein
MADAIAARFSFGGDLKVLLAVERQAGALDPPERRPGVVDEEEAEPRVVDPIDQRVKHRVPLDDRPSPPGIRRWLCPLNKSSSS